MGLFDRFKKGLTKTREKIAQGFRAVLPFGQSIDENILNNLEDIMLAADMGPAIVTDLINDVRAAWQKGRLSEAQDILPHLRERVIERWPEQDRQLARAETKPTVVLVTGVNGSGKTTSIAKLAKHLTDQGEKVMVAACDTYRAAAVEQLTIWAERIGVPIIKQAQGSDPGAVAYDACESALAKGIDVLIVDTAGRLHTQDHLMRELAKIQRVIDKRIPGAPHEVLLVLDATIGQNAVNQARIYCEHVSISGIFLAKLDGSAKGGVVIGIRDQLGVPVKFVGLGETPDDIEPFDPREFASALFAE
ncbi:MAG: signal recognition particle-docking protein FtsY [Planctomycetota bacterium]|nr:signal recognition particle-docking protein FtsY [Planctomycetota bacterium]